MIVPVNTATGSNYGGATTSSLVVTASSLTAGNFIVVAFRIFNPGANIVANSVTDTAGNTYLKAIGRNAVFAGTRGEIWYAYNVLGNASNVVTVNLNTAGNFWGVVTSQYSGVATASNPIDVTAFGDGSSTSVVTSGAFTTTQAEELIVAAADFDSSLGPIWTAGAGYTKRITDGSGVESLEDKIVSTIQTGTNASMTLNQNRNLALNVATFKGPSVATGGFNIALV